MKDQNRKRNRRARNVLLLLSVAALVCLMGCRAGQEPAATTVPSTGAAAEQQTQPQTQPPSQPETVPQTTAEAPEPPTAGTEESRPADAPAGQQEETSTLPAPSEPLEEAEIAFGSFSLFSGQFVEDGRDEPVEQVAAMLVTNTSDQFLDLATLAFEIDGKPAAFVVTGLPAGESAWVLELSGLRAEAGSSFEFCECVPSFRDGVRSDPEELSVTAEGNLLTVKNESDRKLDGVFLYYKNRHTDGNFLGGITYLADVGDLEPGASAQILAGHYDETCSEIVRMGWKNQ